MTESVMSGVKARGGVMIAEIVGDPLVRHGEGKVTDAVVWFLKPGPHPTLKGKPNLWAAKWHELESWGDRQKRSQSSAEAIESLSLEIRPRMTRDPQRDLKGQQFDNWTVKRLMKPGSSHLAAFWECKHKCGYVCCWTGLQLKYREPKCRGCGKR